MLLPFITWLEAQADEAGPELPGETTVAAFRLETATAIVRFIDRKLDAARYFFFRQLGIGTSVGARNTVITAPPET